MLHLSESPYSSISGSPERTSSSSRSLASPSMYSSSLTHVEHLNDPEILQDDWMSTDKYTLTHGSERSSFSMNRPIDHSKDTRRYSIALETLSRPFYDQPTSHYGSYSNSSFLKNVYQSASQTIATSDSYQGLFIKSHKKHPSLSSEHTLSPTFEPSPLESFSRPTHSRSHPSIKQWLIQDPLSHASALGIQRENDSLKDKVGPHALHRKQRVVASQPTVRHIQGPGGVLAHSKWNCVRLHGIYMQEALKSELGSVDPLNKSVFVLDTHLLSRQEIKRQEIIHELLVTEVEFARDLNIILDIFLQGVKARRLMPLADIKIVFGNIEDLGYLHSSFLRRLKDLKRKGLGLVKGLGTLFLKMVHRFKVYEAYCCNYSNSMEYLQNNKSNHRFRMFLHQTFLLPDCRSLDLQAFLLKPIQRICKYPQILNAILNETPPEHEDYHSLTAACLYFKQLVDYLNERRHQLDTQKEVQDVMKKIGEHPDLVTFRSLDRTLIHQGPLIKFSRTSLLSNSTHRHGILFSDCFLWVKGYGERNKGIVRGVVPTSRIVSVVDSGYQDRLKHSFMLVISDGEMQYEYFFGAKTNQEMREWVKAFRCVIKRNKEANCVPIRTCSLNKMDVFPSMRTEAVNDIIMKELPPSPSLVKKFSFSSHLSSCLDKSKVEDTSRMPTGSLMIKENDDLKRVGTLMVRGQAQDTDAMSELMTIVSDVDALPSVSSLSEALPNLSNTLPCLSNLSDLDNSTALPASQSDMSSVISETESEYFSVCSNSNIDTKLEKRVSHVKEELDHVLEQVFVDAPIIPTVADPLKNTLSPKVVDAPSKVKGYTIKSRVLPSDPKTVKTPLVAQPTKQRSSLDSKLASKPPATALHRKPVKSRPMTKPILVRSSLDETRRIIPWR